MPWTYIYYINWLLLYVLCISLSLTFDVLLHSTCSYIRCALTFDVLLHSMCSYVRCALTFDVLLHSMCSYIRCALTLDVLLHSMCYVTGIRTWQVLFGQKYGYRPFPATIEVEEFERVRQAAIDNGCNSKSIALLDKWFLKDKNNLPPMYVLQPITSKIPHYANKVSKTFINAIVQHHNIFHSVEAI